MAEAYERFRPGYPAKIVALAVAPAIGRVARALEVGAGTGKATRVFAAAGIDVIASEPDEAMLGVLTRECADLPVTPMLGAFEDLDPASIGAVDLLYAAAAWHWTDPVTRWDRAADLVRSDGAVALFGGPLEIADPAVATAEERVLARFLPDGAGFPPPSPGAAGLDWPGDELLADPRFDEVRQQQVARRLILSRADYLTHLDTISTVRVLADADRTALFAELLDVLPDVVPLSADLTVHTARRG